MPEKVGMCEFSQLTMFYKQIVIGTCYVPVLGRKNKNIVYIKQHTKIHNWKRYSMNVFRKDASNGKKSQIQK